MQKEIGSILQDDGSSTSLYGDSGLRYLHKDLEISSIGGDQGAIPYSKDVSTCVMNYIYCIKLHDSCCVMALILCYLIYLLIM